jgi:hypothetical protein
MSAVRSALAAAFLLLVASLSLPGAAGAYATIAPPPKASTSSGLPDGRVYEEASPANKHGYQAGATALNPELPTEIQVLPALASADGDAIAFGSSGPAAEVDSSGLNATFVAERTSQGWKSHSTTARGLNQTGGISLLIQSPVWLDYSPDLSHFAYAVTAADVAGAPAVGSGNFYLMGSDPLAEPVWLLRGAEMTALEEQPGTELVGMSPDASIVYIAYNGRLLPQDSSRAGWGIYEYHEGALSEVGVLPDGSLPPEGAMPAATDTSLHERYGLGENNPASLDNQVSEDGRRLFFMAGKQLYVHETEADGSARSVLVSASQLSGHVGEAAPDGVALFRNLTKNAAPSGTEESAPTYAYAAPDGSHVFFQSVDQLTNEAPGGIETKVYDFDVDTGSLEYLPNIKLGGIVTAATDGSSFVFESLAGAVPELDRWSAGPAGGSISPIVQLPGGGFVGPGRLVANGTVLVFQAAAPIAGFNDAGSEQIYRYDIGNNELSCVSCPPAGVTPSGNAYLSPLDQYADRFGLSVPGPRIVNDTRGVSSDGKRIFFDSPDPLVSRDTDGNLDTYEWENGEIFLISSGTSANYSLFLDNSQSGDDVFFATSDELVQGDNDQGFDVYDARVPRPGDTPPPSAVPCSGDVCQGPPSVPQLLGAPPSATFDGAGNIASSSAGRTQMKTKSAPKPGSRSQKLARALKACRRNRSKHKRVVCERQARRRYPAAKATTVRRGK